jgi:hypothetical protein
MFLKQDALLYYPEMLLGYSLPAPYSDGWGLLLNDNVIKESRKRSHLVYLLSLEGEAFHLFF